MKGYKNELSVVIEMKRAVSLVIDNESQRVIKDTHKWLCLFGQERQYTSCPILYHGSSSCLPDRIATGVDRVCLSGLHGLPLVSSLAGVLLIGSRK